MSHRPLCSVVMATYNRAHLLARSLEAYARQDFDTDRFELVVIDDHSNDATRLTVLDWAYRNQTRAVYLTPCPKNTDWRDCGAVLNYGIRAASGDHILLTHPEVIPGRWSVKKCVEVLESFDAVRRDREGDPKDWGPGGGMVGLYACCRVYYLSPQDQSRLDSVPWGEEGNLAVRQIPGFYEEDTNGHPDYSHRATDVVAQPGSRLPFWESFVFGGHSRETWKRLGGMLETQKWGSVDVAWTMRRRTLGIPNHTCPEDETIVVHQNHNMPGDVETPRVEEVWKRELSGIDFRNARSLKYPKVNNLWG